MTPAKVVMTCYRCVRGFSIKATESALVYWPDDSATLEWRCPNCDAPQAFGVNHGGVAHPLSCATLLEAGVLRIDLSDPDDIGWLDEHAARYLMCEAAMHILNTEGGCA